MQPNGTKLKKHYLATAAVSLVALSGVGLAACGGSTTSGGSSGATSPNATGKQVLPVAKNPISNNSSAPGLRISKVLVENNVSPSTGKTADDHIEAVLKNTGKTTLDKFEVYYKISDPAKKTSEGYFTKLNPDFTIKPGASRTVHFDNTGAPDHYPDNKYSLYHADKNALVVDVTASSPTVKPATFSVKKDSGGAEAGVE